MKQSRCDSPWTPAVTKPARNDPRKQTPVPKGDKTMSSWTPCGHPIQTVPDKVEARSRLISHSACGHPIKAVPDKVEARSRLIAHFCLWLSHLDSTRQGGSRIKTYSSLLFVVIPSRQDPTRWKPYRDFQFTSAYVHLIQTVLEKVEARSKLIVHLSLNVQFSLTCGQYQFRQNRTR